MGRKNAGHTRKIKELSVGTFGFSQPDAIQFDEVLTPYLNLEAKFKGSKCDPFVLSLQRISKKQDGFEVQPRTALNAFGPGAFSFNEGGVLRALSNYVSLEICVDGHSVELGGFDPTLDLDAAQNTIADFVSHNDVTFVGKNSFARTAQKQELHQLEATDIAAADLAYSGSQNQALNVFRELFFPAELLDDLIVRFSVDSVLNHELPAYPGAILHGAPGNGKSAVAKAVGTFYRQMGCISRELYLGQMADMYVASLAHNLDDNIFETLKEAREKKVPAFILIDEATTLVGKSEDFSVSDYYSAAIDVMKKYVGNEPLLVFGITTNGSPDNFEEALTREGRFGSIRIPMMAQPEQTRMWQHLITQKNILGSLSMENAMLLAVLSEGRPGSFIAEFCNNYVATRRNDLVRGDNGSLFDGLYKGVRVSEDDVRQSITFDTVRADVRGEVERRASRDSPKRYII